MENKIIIRESERTNHMSDVWKKYIVLLLIGNKEFVPNVFIGECVYPWNLELSRADALTLACDLHTATGFELVAECD